MSPNLGFLSDNVIEFTHASLQRLWTQNTLRTGGFQVGGLGVGAQMIDLFDLGFMIDGVELAAEHTIQAILNLDLVSATVDCSLQ